MKVKLSASPRTAHVFVSAILEQVGETTKYYDDKMDCCPGFLLCKISCQYLAKLLNINVRGGAEIVFAV